MRRRHFIGLTVAVPMLRPVAAAAAAALVPRRAPRPLAVFQAGMTGSIDLALLFGGFVAGVTQLRLRANVVPPGTAPEAIITLPSQMPEYSLRGSRLHFDGGNAEALTAGASAVRLQVEAFQGTPSAALVLSDVAIIQVDAPPAFIRHGLDRWPSFRALTDAVLGKAQPGSAARGRTELIGQTFELTPGMFSEDIAGGTGPVAVLEFPCTLQAMDATRPPVFRSVSGGRDVMQVQSSRLQPIDGEVVLRDLVIRDNRTWYNSGEAGVRIKDRFAGRSVRIERCEFVRCQNAVAGGAPGQTLHILDCRIVDCGFGTQAHGIYVQAGLLVFSGNLVMHSPGARLARAHLLKSRSLESRIVGNRFVMHDCPGSYLIDLPNGGEAEVSGNWLEFGPASDNSFATCIAYGAEGAAGDFGARLFAPGRRFSLAVRNNTFVSQFPGSTHFVALHRHLHPRASGGMASTAPQPLVLADNLAWSRGPGLWMLLRDRTRSASQVQDLSEAYASENVIQSVAPAWASPQAHRARGVGRQPAPATARPSRLAALESRRFSGHTRLGTGSQACLFDFAGAG